jgi:DNA-binding LacI/PurR family transcriptional regulator
VQAECRRLNLELIEYGPFEPHLRSGVAAADLLVGSEVTGVIAYDDVIGLGLIGRLAERGVQAGRDISVIGVDDSPMAALSHPSLTTVHVPGARVGNAAVDLMCETLENPDAAEVVKLDTYLVVRGSTGPAPNAVEPLRPRETAQSETA